MRYLGRFGSQRMWPHLLVAVWVTCSTLGATGAQPGEVLYNGIVLPEVWPPTVEGEDIKARKPIAEPPYRVQPRGGPGFTSNVDTVGRSGIYHQGEAR